MGKDKEPKDQPGFNTDQKAILYNAQCQNCLSVSGFVSKTDLAINSYLKIACPICQKLELYILDKKTIDILS